MLKTLFTVLVFTQSALAVNTMTINGQTYTCGDGQEFRSVNGQIVCLLPTAAAAAAPQAAPAATVAPVATTAPLEPVAPAVAPAAPAAPDTFTNNPASASLITEVYGPTLQCPDGSLAQFVNGSYRCHTTTVGSTSFRDRLRGMQAARNSRHRGSRNSMTIVTHANGSRSYFSCPVSYTASYENSVFTCAPGEQAATVADITTGDMSGAASAGSGTPAAATVVDEVVIPVLDDAAETTVADGSNTVVLNGQTYVCNGDVSISDTQALCNGVAMTATPAAVSQ